MARLARVNLILTQIFYTLYGAQCINAYKLALQEQNNKLVITMKVSYHVKADSSGNLN